MAFTNGYTYRKPVTVDHTKVSGSFDIANFPMLVSLTDISLTPVSNGGKLQSLFDIRFETSGGTKLDYEIDTWNTSSGALIAWVRIPTLTSGSDTGLFVYYGNVAVSASETNSTGVWNSNYKAVYHLRENPTGSAPQWKDSTTNANHITANGTTSGSQLITGSFGNGINLNGTNQSGIKSSPSGLPDSGGPFTLQSWVKWSGNISNWTVQNTIALRFNSSIQTTIQYRNGNPTPFGLYKSGGTPVVGQSFAPTTNVWESYAAATDGTTHRWYRNGTLIATSSVSLPSGGPNNIDFGYYGGSIDEYWSGGVDEVRIVNIPLSASWLATEYNNQQSPNTFYSTGSEQTSAVAITVNASGISAVTFENSPLLNCGSNINCSGISAATTVISPTVTCVAIDNWSGVNALTTVISPSVTIVNPSSGTYTNGYTYRKLITQDHTQVSGSADLINFPMFVQTVDPALKTTINGGHVQNSNGYDIRFETTGGTKLDHEIDQWSAVSGSLNAWVRIPTLSHTTDNTFYMYYGNPSVSSTEENSSGVWTDYLAVYHMKEDPTGTAPQFKDSTGNGYNGTMQGTVVSGNSIAGQLGNALNFNHSNNRVDLGNINFAPAGKTISISNWVYLAALPPGNTVLFTGASSGGNAYYFEVYADGELQWRVASNEIDSAAGAVSTPGWSHLYGTYDGTNVRLYVNGVLIQTVGETGTFASSSVNYIGNDGALEFPWPGYIDESRIVKVTRSSGYIATEYNNQASSSAFISFGTEQSNTSTNISVTVNATGSSVITSTGIVNVSGNENVTLIGDSSATTVGTVKVSSNSITNLTNVNCISVIGTVSVFGKSAVNLTKTNVNTSIGIESVSANSIVKLTNVNANVLVGNALVSILGNVTVNALSNNGISSIGNSHLVANDNSYPNGNNVISNIGTVRAETDFRILVSGNSLITSIGLVNVYGNAADLVSNVNVNTSTGIPLLTGIDNSYANGVQAISSIGASIVLTANTVLAPVAATQIHSSVSAPSIVANSNENLIGQLSSISITNNNISGNSNSNIVGFQAFGNIGSPSIVVQNFAPVNVIVSGTGIITSITSETIRANANEHLQGSNATTTVNVCQANSNSNTRLNAIQIQSQINSVGVTTQNFIPTSLNVSGVSSSGTIQSVAINAVSDVPLNNVIVTTSIGTPNVTVNEQVHINGQSIVTGLSSVTTNGAADTSPQGIATTSNVNLVAPIGADNVYLSNIILNANIGNAIITVIDDNIRAIGVEIHAVAGNVAINASNNVSTNAISSTVTVSNVAVVIGEMIAVLSNQVNTSTGFVMVNASDVTTIIPTNIQVNASLGTITFSSPITAHASEVNVIASIGLVTNIDNSNYMVNGVATAAIIGTVGVIVDHPIFSYVIALVPYGPSFAISSIDIVIKNVTSTQSTSSTIQVTLPR